MLVDGLTGEMGPKAAEIATVRPTSFQAASPDKDAMCDESRSASRASGHACVRCSYATAGGEVRVSLGPCMTSAGTAQEVAEFDCTGRWACLLSTPLSPCMLLLNAQTLEDAPSCTAEPPAA